MGASTYYLTQYDNSGSYGLHLNIDKNGGDTAPASVSAYSSSDAASVTVSKDIPSTLPTRAGHRFLGYAVGSASNGVSKQPGDTMSYRFNRIASYVRTETYERYGDTYVVDHYRISSQAYDYYLYAKWEALTYPVTFDANGGVGAPASQTKTDGTALTLSNVVPTRNGYVFKGWATSPSGAVVYNPGDSYTANAAITLYAVWELAGSTLNSVTASVEVEGTGSASWTPLDPSFTHKLVISCGGAPNVEVTTAAGVSTANFTIPATWYAAIPNAQAATATATLITYDNGIQKGQMSLPFTVAIPASIVPEITAFTADHYSTNATVAGWDEFTQSFSQADLEVTASAGTGATITSVSFSGPSVNQTSDQLTARTGILRTPGTNTFTVTVTDSRGRSSTDTVSVTVYPYSIPTIFSIGTMRADADGTTNNSSGEYLKVQPVYSLSSVNGHNTFSAQTLSYCAHGSGVPIATVNCASGTIYGPPGNMWAIDLSDPYDVTVSVTDALGNTTTSTVTLPGAGGIWVSDDGEWVGIGAVPPGPGFHCFLDASFKQTLDVVPRRVSKQITGSGWFRVLTYEAGNSAEAQGAVGFVIDMTIGKDGINSEAHKVSLFGVYGEVAFKDEVSVSATQLIDKIRYTYENSSPYSAYVDIHLSANPQSVISVDFSVKTKPSYQGLFKALSLDSVANTPSGETVLVEEHLNANTGDGDSGSNTNGRYYRISNGMQICTKLVTITNYGATTAWGSIYEGPNMDFGSWSANFIEAPAVYIYQPTANSGYLMVEGIRDTSASAVGKAILWRASPATVASCEIYIVGIGRWK